MEKHRILFNPLAANNMGKYNTSAAAKIFPQQDTFIYDDITKIGNMYDYILTLPDDEQIIISGGDGTLNRLVNDINERQVERQLYYLATGSGNDFFTDIESESDNGLILLNKYICDLPSVTVNGKKHIFLNGVGYGIDGYCCEVGDKMRASSSKPVNYAAIAIKGLLFHYRPVNAVVTVDGVEHTYRKVWLAPTMNGRYYGGGMMVAPSQDRLNPEKKLSVVVMHGSGKLKTLAVFPSIFKGEHVKHTEMVEVLTGNSIKVEFDKPTALQIDGETITGVLSCESVSHSKLTAVHK